MNKIAAVVIAAAGTASAQDLILTFDISDAANSTVSAEYVGAPFPTANFSAVNALDMVISGLTSFSAPSFPNALLPGVLPDSDPLAAPFGGVDLNTGTVNWFVQSPTNLSTSTGSWLGANHLIGTFSFEGDFGVSISNLSGVFENPADPVIGASSADYIVAGVDSTTRSYEIRIVPAPASAGLLGLAGLAAVRRR